MCRFRAPLKEERNDERAEGFRLIVWWPGAGDIPWPGWIRMFFVHGLSRTTDHRRQEAGSVLVTHALTHGGQ